MTIGPDDSVYCVDNGDHTVRQFTPEGKLLMTLGTQGSPSPAMSGVPFCKPAHLAVDPRNGDMYVADGYCNASVHKYTPDGRHLLSWGESGTAAGQFNIVYNVAVDADGWVYVADRENHRVQVFDDKGRFETQWVNLSRAACLAIVDNGQRLVYVGEYHCGIGSNWMGTGLGPRVSILNAEGEVLARVGALLLAPRHRR